MVFKLEDLRCLPSLGYWPAESIPTKRYITTFHVDIESKIGCLRQLRGVMGTAAKFHLRRKWRHYIAKRRLSLFTTFTR